MSTRTKLGRVLRGAREVKGLSLRAVEAETGISNAYLSQLESGRIQSPSPIVLHKLSKAYKVPYSRMLESAGYPVPGNDGREKDASQLASRLGPITEQEEDALAEYLDFIRSRRRRRSGQ